MLSIDVIRAWKNEDYRASLTDEQLPQLPANPAGGIEVRQSDRNIFETGRHTDRGGVLSKSHGACC